MRKPRVAIGIAFMAAGTAAAIGAARAVIGDSARAEAALVAAESVRAQEQSGQQLRAERAVAAAAQEAPLVAALREHVDGPTLLDLFDSEDWWRPYRADFPAVRVSDGARVLASRGPDLGPAADPVVAAARKQPIASDVVKVGDENYVVAATEIHGLAPGGVILTVARRFVPASSVGAAAGRAEADPNRPVTWAAAFGLALCGLGLILSGRQAVADIPAEVPHEPTSRFGTAVRRRVAAEGAPKPRLSDGTAIQISHPSPARPDGGTSPAQAAPATRGTIFGRYRLLDRLGQGGMSELFVAEATGVEGFKRNFVLKRLRRELARDRESVAQFIDEARLQAGLVHSNIVPVFDFGIVNGEYFMTQEYIVGRDLARFVGRYAEQHQTGLPAAMASYVAHETLQALAYAHEKRDRTGAALEIVHRDISAGNVMVSLLGEVKLGDFGIVKSNRRVTQTQAGMVKGNANFMSPEQARGHAVDHRSDLFSLGHVLYYCLTGCLLYDGENDLDVLYRAATGPTEEDLESLRCLPEPAASILERALAFDPDHRFQNATEFAEALAPHAGTGKTATAKLMQQLFGDELRRQVGATASSG